MNIRIIGDIDEEAFRQFDIKLTRLEEDGYEGDVGIDLMSSGGDAYSALAFYDRMRNTTNQAFTVRAYGLVASAAVLILAAGDVRQMASNAWVMVHEDGTEVEDRDRVSVAERSIKHARRMEDQWNNLLARRTRLSAEEWAKLNEPETYLDAEECLKAGLIDEVI
jgi:ATP-dependent Clp protease, protease subunit